MKKTNKLLKTTAVLFLFIAPTAYGQDSTYYANDGQKVPSRNKAYYYEVTKENEAKDSKEVLGYYLSGVKKAEKTMVVTNTKNLAQKNAKPSWGIDGTYQEWFENGNLKITAKYRKGKRVGELKTYWQNGTVKRLDYYEDNEQQYPHEKFKEGTCFNEAGKKIGYFPYYQAAKFPGGQDSMKVYMSRNLKNDLTDSLRAINVKFFIDKKGEVSRVQLNKRNASTKAETGGDTKKIEAEITNVLSSMPKWNPALEDGDPVGEYQNKDFFYGKVFDKDGVFSLVPQMPTYKGGESALLQTISKNLKYPVTAMESKITGTVILRFVVTKTGSIGEPTVIRGIGGACDEEAIRAVKTLTNWTPGTIYDTPVNVYYVLPVTFRMQ